MKEEKNKNLQRNSNIEMLRILATIMILAHHYASHGFVDIQLEYSLNKYILDILSLFGKVGVNCFVLISGYFMVFSNIKFNRIIKILCQTWFYSYLLLFISLFIDNSIGGITEIVKCFLPFMKYHYWFISAYIILMIISPYLNVIIDNIKKKELQKIIVIFTILWSVIPTFLIGVTFDLNNIGWFTLLYFIGAYIRKYKISSYKYKYITLVSISSLILSSILLNYIGYSFNLDILINHARYFSNISNIIVLIISISLFINFSQMKYNNNKLINIISSSSLGVYLISDHILFKKIIWQKIFKCNTMFDSHYLIIHAIICISLCFVICTLVDLIRQMFLEKQYLKISDVFFIKIKILFNKLLKWLVEDHI